MSLLATLQTVKASRKLVEVDGVEEKIPVRLVNQQEFDEFINTILPLVDEFFKIQDYDKVFINELGEFDGDMYKSALLKLLQTVPEKAIDIALFFMGWDKDNDEQYEAVKNLPLYMVIQIAAGGIAYNIEALKSAFDRTGNVLPFLQAAQVTQEQATA